MTLSIALQHRFGDFALQAAFEAPPGVTALFGRSGSGKSTVVNAVAGLLRPDQGRIALGGGYFLTVMRVSTCRRTAAGWAMCFKMRGFFRI